MICNSLNVKLSDSQLDKLKSAIKNETKVVLRLSSNMIGDDETSFPHKLLLINCKLREKSFFIARSCNLGLVANTFTASKLFSCTDKVNLPLRFQMDFSKKLKTFSQFFIVFLKLTLIFEHFENDQVS